MPVDLATPRAGLSRTKITFISPHVDTDSQTLLVKSRYPNADMKFPTRSRTRPLGLVRTQR